MRPLVLLNTTLLTLSAITLIGLQLPLGLLFLLVGAVISVGLRYEARSHFLLLYASLFVLSLTHINTDLSDLHMVSMGLKLTAVIALAYFGTKFLTPAQAIDFDWHWEVIKQPLSKKYLIIGMFVGLVIIPFYYWHTQAFLNWSVDFSPWEITKLFIGTNGLGIWDELFFINFVFVVLRYHLKFWYANVAQAVLFASFLFELGFTGWGPLMIFVFALLQGCIYEKTKSLGLVLILHLTLDFILFLSLLYLHWIY